MKELRQDLASTQSRIWARNLLLIVSNDVNNKLPRVHYPESHSLPFFMKIQLLKLPACFSVDWSWCSSSMMHVESTIMIVLE